MNLDETAVLLTFVAAHDNRNESDAQVEVWQEALADVLIADARAVVAAHFRESEAYLMPVHVRQGVRALRARRLDTTSVDDLPLPPHLDPDDVAAYLAWKRETTEAVASGTYQGPPVARALGPAVDVASILRRPPPEVSAAQRAQAIRERRERIERDSEEQRTRSLAALQAGIDGGQA